MAEEKAAPKEKAPTAKTTVEALRFVAERALHPGDREAFESLLAGKDEYAADGSDPDEIAAPEEGRK
jgi:hypothetical protein